MAAVAAVDGVVPRLSGSVDLNKLLLAAAGILVMAIGWWLLAVIFAAKFDAVPPGWPETHLPVR